MVKKVSHQMDMIFTHFGISGPAALRCSQFVYKEQKNQKEKYPYAIRCFPELNVDQLSQKVRKILNAEPDKYIKNSLRGLIEERYLLFILEQSGINDEMTAHHLSNQQFQTFINLLKTFTFTVDGTLPLDKAFCDRRRYFFKRNRTKTMMSKLVPGLFLCGEVLDIHGYTGGYNITSALVTGHVAGMFA